MHLIGRRHPREAYPVRNPGSPGALVSPLTAQYWVDSDTTLPAASRTGSILAPFASLQEAHDAAVTAGFSAVSILAVKSDVADSLTCTIDTSVNGLSGFVFVAGPNYQVRVGNLTVNGVIVFAASNLYIAGDVSAPDGASLQFDGCIHLGDINAPNGTQLYASQSLLCAGGISNVVLDTINFFDAFTEQQMLATSVGAWAANSRLTSTNAGTGANVADVMVDANEAPTFTGASRLVLPANTITAPRTITLSVGGAGDFATGYVDVYEQAFDVTIEDSVGPATLVTVTAGTNARRYGFQLPDGTSWVQFSTEIFGV